MVLGSASQSALLQTETEVSIESDSGALNESSSDTCDTLLQQLDSNLTVEEIDEWISAGVDYPGHQIFSDEDIVAILGATNPPPSKDQHRHTCPTICVTIRGSSRTDMIPSQHLHEPGHLAYPRVVPSSRNVILPDCCQVTFYGAVCCLPLRQMSYIMTQCGFTCQGRWQTLFCTEFLNFFLC